jgi:hypothetical protein
MSIQTVFTAAESRAIMESIKTKIGPAFSITHLGHAAMVMTALQFKSPQERPSSNRFVSPLFINGRRYLDPKHEPKPYVPMCRAIGAVVFRDVDRYMVSEDASKEEIQQKLRLACEEARRSYQAIREQQSLLTESFSVAELMATAKNHVKDKGMADPFFLSDGIVEQYISRSYTGGSGTNQVLMVHDVRFTANPDGPPLSVLDGIVLLDFR